jgi:hypothetical protein
MQQMITAEEALALIGTLSEAVRRHVHDRAMLAAISTEFRQLTNRTQDGGAP